MSEGNQKQPEDLKTVSLSSTLDAFVSPNKMLVESATMIFIIAFMLFSFGYFGMERSEPFNYTSNARSIRTYLYNVGSDQAVCILSVLTGIACP